MQATNENRWKLIKNINSLRHATGEYFKRTHTHARPTPMHTHTPKTHTTVKNKSRAISAWENGPDTGARGNTVSDRNGVTTIY